MTTWLLPLALFGAMVFLVGTVRSRSQGLQRLPSLERAAGGTFPLTLRAAGGRGEPQTIQAAPQRVLLANATLVDLATQLIAPERVVALPAQSLTWSRLVDVDGGFRAKANFREVNAESVLAFAPDLVVCSSFNTTFGGDWARRAGVPILSLPHPESLAELRDIVSLLGRALDAEPAAAALLRDVDGRIAALAQSAGRRRGLGAMTYSNYGAGGWTAGPGDLGNDLIELAGMPNVAARIGKRGSTRCTFEDILAAWPDVLVVPGRFGEQDGATYEVLLGEPALAQVPAIAAGRVIRLHPRLFSAGSQEVVTAAERLAAAVDATLGAARTGERGR